MFRNVWQCPINLNRIPFNDCVGRIKLRPWASGPLAAKSSRTAESLRAAVRWRYRRNIGSPFRFHRYWSRLAGSCQRRWNMHPRTTNISTQTYDVCRFSFESAGALALDNEYSGFAVAPARYIAFAERKHACPWQVLYRLRRFTWQLYRICNSRPMSASTGQIPSTTSACKQRVIPSTGSTASPTRQHALTSGRRRCTSDRVAQSRLPLSWPRGRSSLHYRSTTSSCSSRSIPRRSPNIE